MTEKIIAFFEEHWRHVAAVLALVYALLWLANFMGIGENLLWLVGILLSPAVVVIGFAVWLAVRHEEILRGFLKGIVIRISAGCVTIELTRREVQGEESPEKFSGLTGEIPEGTPLAGLRKQAESGDAQAQFRLGLAYYFGKGVEKNAEKATEWTRRSAEQGHMRAEHNLGVAYAEGFGGKEDFPKAAKWFRRAAEKGFAQSQYNLGRLYHLGHIVSPNNTEAESWFRFAAEQGHADAQLHLGVILSNKDDPDSKKESFVQFSLSALGGNCSALQARDSAGEKMPGDARVWAHDEVVRRHKEIRLKRTEQEE